MGLSRLIAPLADMVEQAIPIEGGPAFTAQPLQMLRPPGALPESEFLSTCHRCGLCADSCPATAIRLRSDGDERQRGTPYVDASLGACVVCDELACMKVCPSGALRLVDRLDIRMGLARVNEPICVRSTGEDCTICVDRCPLGATAIRIHDGRVAVIEPDADLPDGSGPAVNGCVGCGVCQFFCPTTPKAIVVRGYNR